MHVRRNLAALLAAPCLLSACGGGSTSVADPPVSSAPTSSATTAQPEHESPEHFIRRFAAIEQKMETTGDLKAYLRLTQRCHECVDLAHQVQGFYEAGGYVHWRGWQIKSIRRTNASGGHSTYAVRVNSAPTFYREASGAALRHLDGGPSTELITLTEQRESWIVVARARSRA
jgi:hypothetical protein